MQYIAYTQQTFLNLITIWNGYETLVTQTLQMFQDDSNKKGLRAREKKKVIVKYFTLQSHLLFQMFPAINKVVEMEAWYTLCNESSRPISSLW